MTEGAMTLLAELESTGIIDARSLRIDDPDFPFERWIALGQFFGEAKTRLSFYMGDWLNFGEGVYGERFSQALAVTPYAKKTLFNYSSVCRRVARSRRREDLAFGHHDAVSSLVPADQERWLAKAADENMSVGDLRDAIRTPPAPEQMPEPLHVKPIIDAAADLTVIHDALERIHHGEIATVDLPRALRAVDRSAETLKVASRVPTILDAVERLLEHAEPTEDGSGYTVAAAALDELRTLVVSEGGNG